jgi:hypothetical protein
MAAAWFVRRVSCLVCINFVYFSARYSSEADCFVAALYISINVSARVTLLLLKSCVLSATKTSGRNLAGASLSLTLTRSFVVALP